MKKYLFCFLLIISFFPAFSLSGSDPIKTLVQDFLSNDWPTVLSAKEKIENLGATGIPEMMTIMNNCQIVKLKNTGDLIYPGAERFFGHGQIIDYDIDDVCIRAGWLMEEITFRNFGFSGIHLPAEELSDFVKKTFPEYYAIQENRTKEEKMDETGRRNLIRTLSIERAKNWWAASSRQWNRLASLEEALTGKDEKSQVKALFYMRNGVTQCKGLNQKYYKSKLSKVVDRLSRSATSRVSENAKLIMLDSDFTWLALKPVN